MDDIVNQVETHITRIHELMDEITLVVNCIDRQPADKVDSGCVHVLSTIEKNLKAALSFDNDR